LFKIHNQKQSDGTYNALYLYKRLFKYIRPYLWRAVIAVLLTIPIGALTGAITYSLKPYTDEVLLKHSVASVSYVPFVIIGFTLVQGVLKYFSIYLNGWLGNRIVIDLREALLKKLQTLEVAYFDQHASGEILQYFYGDAQIVQTGILNNINDFLTGSFTAISLAGVLFYLSWQLALIAIGCTVFILLPSTRIRGMVRALNAQTVIVGSKMMSFYNDTTMGIRVIYSYNLPELRLKQFNNFQQTLFNQCMKLVKTQGWLTPSMNLIASVGLALTIWSGTSMVTHGQLTLGAFISFVVTFMALTNPIKNLGQTFMNAQASIVAAGRTLDRLDKEPLIQDAPDAVELREMEEGIHFDKVYFEYVADKPVLHEMDLYFRKGETVALVGNSGGGKSTISSLLPRFYDVTRGAIRIDGIDIRHVTLESLRHQISLVAQDNFLFGGTLRENILYGNSQATEDQIGDALDKAYLTDFVNSLSEGLETRIGERGVMLSGGQRQRVAIARALLKDSPIVILDEATSALDNQSEAIVQKAIESLMLNRTVIVIAHRLSTIRNADRIVVVSEGHIAEEGSHQDLLALDGIYAMLYNTQFVPHAETAPSALLVS
jgi:ATP-binding cassette, subfamily B, bacterial MsbA